MIKKLINLNTLPQNESSFLINVISINKDKFYCFEMKYFGNFRYLTLIYKDGNQTLIPLFDNNLFVLLNDANIYYFIDKKLYNICSYKEELNQ